VAKGHISEVDFPAFTLVIQFGLYLLWSILAAGTFPFHNSRIGGQFIGRNDENYGPDLPLFPSNYAYF